MATFKELNSSDIKSVKSFLNTLVEIVGEDVSSSVSRRKYEIFVTGGSAASQPGVTSSLFHTIYDQDFSLQTANALFDITVGLNPTGSQATGSEVGTDQNGKRLYPTQSLMMREKINIYRQYAEMLLGDAGSAFTAPLNSSTAADRIDAALFINIKRLFHRDQIKRGSTTILLFQSGTVDGVGDATNPAPGPSLKTTCIGQATYTTNGGDTNKLEIFGGGVENIVSGTRAIASQDTVGLNFVDQGIIILDIAKVFSSSQRFTGTIDAINGAVASTNGKMPFTGTLNQFLVSASLNDVIDHFASTRFGTSTNTQLSFQNQTNINSTLFFCSAGPDEFNYSSNPTYVDSSNQIQVIESGQEDVQKSFTFITSVGLYDANNNLLAVAKVSRPIEKHVEKNLSLRIRLDY